MTDKPELTNGTEQAEETIFNSDIGDDWGEAFQAEDFMFSPDEEASSEFFLEDDSFDDGESSTDAEEMFAEADASLFDTQAIPKGSAWLDKLLSLIAILLNLPLKYRIPAIGLPIALLITLFFSFRGSDETTDMKSMQEDSALQTAEQEKAPGSDQNVLSPESEKKKQLAKSVEVIDKVRKRWKLPSFFISSFNEQDKSTALLAIDLTFVLLLNREDVIPDENELLVRETIYQFFNNRPYSELERFALSRGEMNRSLIAWIHKQLPDIPLSSIVFERYQIL